MSHEIAIADRLNGSPPLDTGDAANIWPYGVTDQPGHLPGSLFYADGMDIDVDRDWKAALTAPGK